MVGVFVVAVGRLLRLFRGRWLWTRGPEQPQLPGSCSNIWIRSSSTIRSVGGCLQADPSLPSHVGALQQVRWDWTVFRGM